MQRLDKLFDMFYGDFISPENTYYSVLIHKMDSSRFVRALARVYNACFMYSL